MSKLYGIWIDHRKAVIVSLINGKERIRVLRSDVERRVRASGGARSKESYGPQDVLAEDSRDRKFRQHLHEFYQDVCNEIPEAESLYLFGPGEAKTELRKCLEDLPGNQHLFIDMDTSDKMTNRQIAARVRHHFRTQVAK